MKTRIYHRAMAVTLVMLTLLFSVPAQAEWLFNWGNRSNEPKELQTEQTSILRVKLASLDAPVALGLTLAGSYTVDGDKGFRFERDSELAVAADGETLLLKSGGLTIDMGSSILFKRHAVKEGAENGVYIHENKHNTLYQGDLLLSVEDGAILPVLYIDIDDYLYGVVPFEMSDSFPIEALKAQAVAARTYALSRRDANQARAFDVVDTTADQVFRGFNADYENAIRAVDETRYVAGLYKDRYATCYFGASNGGQTATPMQLWSYEGDYGYLDVRDDPYDLENTQSVVKRLTIDASNIDSRILRKLRDGLKGQVEGDVDQIRIAGIEPVEPKFEGTRMFQKLRFALQISTIETNEAGESIEVPSEGEYHVDLDFYNDLKPNFDLKINAANCEIASVVEHFPENAVEGDLPVRFDIESRRFGHGVGMSQRGAQQMAGQHAKTWIEILQFYYPNLELYELAFQVPELDAIDALPASLGYARARPTPKPTPAPLPALSGQEYYAKAKLATRAGTLNVREQPGTEAKIAGLLNNGQRMIVVREMDDGWAEIKTVEVKGYVSMEYLERE